MLDNPTRFLCYHHYYDRQQWRV